MKYIIQGKEKIDKIMMLIGFTSIKSKKMHSALIDYYCSDNNRKKRAVANIFEVQEANLCRDIKKINFVAGELERYKEMEWPDYQALRNNKKAA